ncbi:MAG: antibiotic biosynthesis monooxygenase [Rhodomicrobium sp.]
MTYIEVRQSAHAKAVSALRAWAAAVHGNKDNIAIALLNRRELNNHFAIVQIWKNFDAFNAQAASSEGRSFKAALSPLLIAPIDERPHSPLAADALRTSTAIASARGGTIFVITHVDIIPTRKDEGIAATRALAEPSRREPGNISFDVLQQTSRANHMTLFEAWKNEREMSAHAERDFIVSYRTALLPMAGSLYDQRTYRSIR